MNPILALRPDDKQSTPLYLQLARKLEAAIHAGEWKSEQALPSERVLSEQLSISRVTARKALEVLFAQGLIRRSQGSGTFITRVWSSRCRACRGSARCCASRALCQRPSGLSATSPRRPTKN